VGISDFEHGGIDEPARRVVRVPAHDDDILGPCLFQGLGVLGVLAVLTGVDDGTDKGPWQRGVPDDDAAGELDQSFLERRPETAC
jgi:hypothetical protein